MLPSQGDSLVRRLVLRLIELDKRKLIHFWDHHVYMPHPRTDVYDIRRMERETGRHLMHPIHYLIASYDHFIRTGEYFDQAYFAQLSRINDPRRDGDILIAKFDSHGHPYVNGVWYPDFHRGGRCARLEQLLLT